jgi:hypothetical protein
MEGWHELKISNYITLVDFCARRLLTCRKLSDLTSEFYSVALFATLIHKEIIRNLYVHLFLCAKFHVCNCNGYCNHTQTQ